MSSTKDPPPTAPIQTTDPAQDKNLIRIYDSYGQEFLITREEWRKNVLPDSLKKAWNDPDNLYSIIVSALKDGFYSDIVNAAKQLYKIEPQHMRSACVLGIVLIEEGQLDKAENVFRDFMAKYGEDGVILNNLAKIYVERKDDAKAEEILWHGLEVDPNQDNAVGWYEQIYRERGGEQVSREALKRIAALPGSWRAQLWLARAALQSQHLDQALAYYHESLSRIGKEVPADLLMQMSGDLGRQGYLGELLQLTKSYFVAEKHGLQVGNNLIKAHLDLGEIEAARQIINQLYAVKRPDWKDTLSFWDQEIAKASLTVSGMGDKQPLTGGVMSIEGPIWLSSSSPAVKLFPESSREEPSICFFGSSAETAKHIEEVQHQLSDAPGRMSRILPLFLTEQVYFKSKSQVQTLIPVVKEEAIKGFVLYGISLKDQDIISYALQGPIKSDYVIITHLKTQAEPWVVELRLVRTIDGKCLANLSTSFMSAKPEEGIIELGEKVVSLLANQAHINLQTSPPFYQVPESSYFSSYLTRLEQLLAVRCSAADAISGEDFLYGEREMIDGNLQLCLAYPKNVTVRLLLAQTLLSMKKVRPDILPEYIEKITLLQEKKPLDDPAHGILESMLKKVWKHD